MTNSIALINPCFQFEAPGRQLFRPLGIACLASQMKSLGLAVFITDCTFKSYEESVREIVARDPAVTGFTISIETEAAAFRMLRELRERISGSLFIAGGPMPTVFPERYADRFDVVFRGEGDLVVPRFCRDYLALRKRDRFHNVLEFFTYPGVYTRFRSQLIQYAPIHYPAPILDSLPIPYRKDFDHVRYQRHWMEWSGSRPITVMATRGCPYESESGSNPVFGRIYRKRSLERVIREIDVAERDGYSQVRFVDDSFTYDGGYVRSFCEHMAARPAPMEWTCRSRTGELNPSLAGSMHSAGCVMVNLDLDSGVDETLRLMGRPDSVAERLRASEMLSRAGIRVGASFLVGYPGESRESIEQTLSLALSGPFDAISFNMPFHVHGATGHEREYLANPGSIPGSGDDGIFHYSREIDPRWLSARVAETLDRFRGSRDIDAPALELAAST